MDGGKWDPGPLGSWLVWLELSRVGKPGCRRTSQIGFAGFFRNFDFSRFDKFNGRQAGVLPGSPEVSAGAMPQNPEP